MRHELLIWYDRVRRDLPWRRTREPYPVWVSEVMLQQTRVDVVLPYYQRFLERFPTVEALAAAGEAQVLALWSGLGYYRRARQLHAAARRVVERGGFPETPEGWRELAGVGDYTSAAVASICFGALVPVLDGNVERLLARFLALAEDPKSAAARRRLRAAAAELLDPARPGDSNQALMELGATICTPRRPSCPACPLLPGCRAAAEGTPENYPQRRPRRARERRRVAVAVVEWRRRVLLVRRPEGDTLLGGFWELPWAELDGGAAPPETLFAQRYGGSWRLGEPAARVRHAVTFRDLEVAIHRAEVADTGSLAEGREAGWFDEEGRRALPLSSLVGKALAALRSEGEVSPPPARRRAPRASSRARRPR
ncbi:MAG TPA: A/G-specific adenine glycosylase [Thermoanaerobaculia bacterium]|nr:A/G-specific adenine glycosylase [Thermoanaerobaculia bacterium]